MNYFILLLDLHKEFIFVQILYLEVYLWEALTLVPVLAGRCSQEVWSLFPLCQI